MEKITGIIIVALLCGSAAAQNVSLNIITQNSGKVQAGSFTYLELTICNHDAAVAVPAYKLKPQISVPAALVSLPAAGHKLPPGWSITAAKGSQIWLSNGTDTLAPGGCRTILLRLQAAATGGPSTISGNLLFSNSKAPGFTTGSPLPGDSPADNNSTTTIEVLKNN